MSHTTDGRSPSDNSKRAATDAPSRELEPGEETVGMGFFPAEVDLPAGWTWEANRVTR